MTSKVFIIAEAGVNHNGSLEKARELIYAAKVAGADAVKFQTWKTEYLCRADTPLVGYQKSGGMGIDMYEMEKLLELKFEDFRKLHEYCHSVEIEFLSTAFDRLSLQFLVNELNISLLKVPSGEAVNVPLLRDVAQTNLPVILSTGMCTLDEIGLAIATLNRVWEKAGNKKNITLLQCTTAYPTPPDQIHLRAMGTLKSEFNLPVGFSDHSEGIAIATAAAALGATIIEKHYTLDKSLPGPDHKTSLDPNELTAMVSAIRTVEQALGSEEKICLDVERETISLVRRSLVANCDIAKSTIITEEMLVALRPEDGIPAREIDAVIGRPSWQHFKKGAVLQWP